MAEDTVKGRPNLQRMNDIYSLELIQVLPQAAEAGILRPDELGGGWILHMPMIHPSHSWNQMNGCC